MKKHRKGREALSFIPFAARDLFFPPRCVGCDELLPPFVKRTTVFCPRCLIAWDTAVAKASLDAAKDAERGLVYFVHYRSGYENGVPERLIYHLKHRGDSRAFAFVAKELVPRLREVVVALSPCKPEGEDMLLLFTYPPRRRSGVNRDGYDQAERLAKVMAKACGGEFATLIKRTHRRTAEQKTLTAHQRATNAASAYVLSPHATEDVRDRTVVICDDLRTTGETMNRCAELLMGAGARSVILCAVAQTEEKKRKNI